MTGFSHEQLEWASRAAAQLRLIQADCADGDPKERRNYLEEEIGRSLRGIVPEQRSAYLRALSARFPIGEGGAAPARPSAEAAPVAATPEQLVDQLTALAKTLPPGKLVSLGSKLQAAGFLAAPIGGGGGGGGTLGEPTPEFLERFPLPPGQQVDGERLHNVAMVLGEFFTALDKVVWNIWKAISPKSRVRKDPSPLADFRNLSGRYLAGDREVSMVQLRQIVDRVRQLTAAILAAIGPAGGSFAKQHLARFSPEAIKNLAAAESGMFLSIEQKCWRKYSELAAEFTEDTVESEIQEAIGRYAEDLMRGRHAD